MKINFYKIINFIVEGLLLFIVFYIPLHFGFYLETNEVFEFHKFFIFRILFFTLIFFWFLKIVFFVDIKKLVKTSFFIIKKYFWPLSFFLFFCLLSVLWSVDPRASLFGSLSRQFGWFNYFFLFVFLFILVLEIITSNNYKDKLKFFLYSILSSSFLVSLYAICQFFAWNFFQWSEPPSLTGRAFSTLGQPNFLGMFLILSIPISLYFLKKSKKIFGKTVCLLIFLFQILALFFSGSRSAWIGFLISLIFVLFIFYFKNNKKIFYFSFLFLLLFFCSLFFLNKSFNQRTLSSFDFNSGSTAARAWLWPKAIEAFIERPMGYGLENQREALIPFYEKRWAEVNVVNVVFDRSHNVFLDYLLCLGFFGFIFFCFLLFLLSKILIKNLRKKEDNDLFVFISSSFLAYIISLQFNFSSLATSLVFLTLLALVFVLDLQDNFILKENCCLKSSKEIKERNSIIFKIFILILVFTFSFYGIKKELNLLEDDYYFFQSKKYLSQGSFGEGLLMFSYLNKDGYKHDDYAYYLADVFLGNYVRDYFQEKSLDFLIKEEVRESLKKIEDRKFIVSKNSFFFNFFKAKSLSILGDQESSEKIFLDLINKSPYFPDLYLNYARHKIMFNDFDDSLNLLYNTVEMLPKREVRSDISRNALSFYRNLIFYEISNVRFKIEKSSVK
ncbi:MAG: oligosaccharide repeat unit polymerase [Patescibacteria group bacterium]|nr:O-antigen ligase family protein [Patescibacteria group bacterium]